MNFKTVSIRLFQSVALMALTNLALAQAQGATSAEGTAAPTAQSASDSGDKLGRANASQTASSSALRWVVQETSGRDAQGNMRIQLIDGGIKLPAKQ